MSLPNTNVGAFDARTRFFELLELIEAGEEVTIMRHGKAVARIVPPTIAATPKPRKERTSSVSMPNLSRYAELALS
ncbi:type II toxin-antitoxin system Phd/YefM family antitoxin [Lacipirellula sp.]|uniref:type II toxin-antitoxin system Phd/YefM family antitoxin n=1 Tax=Lacipirellula sp. TaxID=2691419 RepID=UPI003D0B066A